MTNDNRMDVFDAIRKYVDSTQYVVIPIARIQEETGNKYSKDEVDASLTVLQLNGLLLVGFSDGECYCLALTQKGIREGELRDIARAEAEKIALAVQEEEARRNSAKIPPAHPKEEKEEEEVRENNGFVLGKKEKIKLALLCGGSAFLGALLAGIATLIVVLVKVV